MAELTSWYQAENGQWFTYDKLYPEQKAQADKGELRMMRADKRPAPGTQVPRTAQPSEPPRPDSVPDEQTASVNPTSLKAPQVAPQKPDSTLALPTPVFTKAAPAEYCTLGEAFANWKKDPSIKDLALIAFDVLVWLLKGIVSAVKQFAARPRKQKLTVGAVAIGIVVFGLVIVALGGNSPAAAETQTTEPILPEQPQNITLSIPSGSDSAINPVAHKNDAEEACITQVVPVDTTWNVLAKSWGQTTDHLLDRNPTAKSRDSIRVSKGTLIVLCYPKVTPKMAKLYPTLPAPTPQKVCTYKVQKGDTATKIAGRFSTTVSELKKLNAALRSNPNRLKVGQVLTVCG